MTVVSVLEYILDFCTLDEGLRMREEGVIFMEMKLGRGGVMACLSGQDLGTLGSAL